VKLLREEADGNLVPIRDGQRFVLATDMVKVVEQRLLNTQPFSRAQVFMHKRVESVARVVLGDRALMVRTAGSGPETP